MRISDVDILIVPELRKLLAGHWQARWADRLKTARLINTDAIGRDGARWTEELRTNFADARRPTVVVAHGLGVIAAVSALAGPTPEAIAGVFLVAPVDVSGATNGMAKCFDRVPMDALSVPSCVVATGNDPTCQLERAREFAAAWGSVLAEAGDCGHLDDASGHGPWPEGLLRFGAFLKSLG